jgi:2,3-bisphosphoglycerate-dependent phosphoglycerate mutase
LFCKALHAFYAFARIDAASFKISCFEQEKYFSRRGFLHQKALILMKKRANFVRIKAMKIIVPLFAVLFLLGFTISNCFAQKKTITVIIFRHAEKELPTEGDETEPDISIEGQKRAVRLVKVLEKYEPVRLFSTNYPRTIQTVTPLSRIKNLPLEFYEPGNMNALVEKIFASENQRRIAVVGHNSTTFQLANLLLKNSKYTMPPESEYGKIWILRIKNGKVKDKVISY